MTHPRTSGAPRALLTAAAIMLAGAPAGAHVFETNLYPDIELKKDHLAIELWIATFLFPPLAHIDYGDGKPRPDAAALREQIESYFAETCPIAFDDVVVKPQLEWLKFQEMDGVSHLGENKDLTMAKLLLRYPVEGDPRRLKLRWGIWFDDSQVTVEQDDTGEVVTHDPNVLDMLIFVHGEEYPIYISKQEPEVVWHAPPRVFGDAVADVPVEPPPVRTATVPLAPVLIIACVLLLLLAGGRIGLPPGVRYVTAVTALAGAFAARGALPIEVPRFWDRSGAPELTEEAAEDEFLRLHRGIYRAFEGESEDAIYNTLAKSVDGPMLDRLYEEVYQSLIMRDEGGATSRVRAVDYLETEVSPLDESEGYAIACRWQVHGAVSHFGHTHRRSNEYQADYTIEPRGERWKIASATVNLQKRVKAPKPSESGGGPDPRS